MGITGYVGNGADGRRPLNPSALASLCMLKALICARCGDQSVRMNDRYVPCRHYERYFTSIVGRSMPRHTEKLLALLLLSYHQVIELTNLLGNSV